MTQTRIYTVTDGENDEKYLIRAASQAQAIAHVSRRFRAAVATQEQLVRLLDDGIEVETAGTARDPHDLVTKVAGLQQQLRDIEEGAQA